MSLRVPRTVVLLAVALGGAAAVAACASIAGFEDPEMVDVDGGNTATSTNGGESDDASTVVDGSLTTPLGVTISPAEIDLGIAKCAEAAKNGTITITNGGSAPAPFEVSLPANETFTLRSGTTTGAAAVNGELAPGAFAFIYLDAKGTAPGTATTDVVVKAGGLVQQIKARLDVRGAQLVFDPLLVNFGEVRNSSTSTLPVILKNDGNESVSITGFVNLGQDFTLTPTTTVLAGGEAKTFDATFKTGTTVPEVTAQVSPQVVGAQCRAAPTLTLKGTHVNQDVTVGPLAVDLGKPTCGTSPVNNQAKIAVTNYSTSADAVYTATLVPPATGAARFKIISGQAGTVPQTTNSNSPTKAEITIGIVTPIALPLGDFVEDLEVNITAPVAAVATKTVKLHVGAYGAILEVTPPSLSGFAVNEVKAFAIKNVGNAKTCVRYDDISGNGFYIEGDGDELLVNENDDLRVQFAATNSGTYNYTIPIVQVSCSSLGYSGTSSPICTAVPKPTISATR